MLARLKRFVVGRYWGRAFAEGGLRTWMHEPVVREYINCRVTGSAEIWPMEWFKERFAAQPFSNGLSLGCGEGALERDLRRKEICTHLVGLDVSRQALELAEARLLEEGLDGVTYRLADLNSYELPEGEYDCAFVHQAMHHVEGLEHCMDQVKRSLLPGGLFYVDEYVGPSRASWKRDLLGEAEEVFQSIPRDLRRRNRLAAPVDWRDPSEGIRSEEIVEVIASRFTIEEKRDYGGNLFAVIYPHLQLDGASPADRDAILREIVTREEELLEGGARSFYSVLIAR